jgi:hypothetical protein
LMKGSMPSMTRYSANAANKSDQFIELVSGDWLGSGT